MNWILTERRLKAESLVRSIMNGHTRRCNERDDATKWM
jgi:hypothetical protein